MLRWIVIAVLAMPALPLQGAQPQFWKIEGAGDFLAGEIEGLAVDSDGHVRLAPAARALHDPAAPFVWCLAADAKGRIFAGTGSDGKVFRIDAGQGALFFDAAELEVHALAAGPDGKLYVGTSPDGKVYSVDEQGHGSVFFDPTDKYIWGLAFDPEGRLLVATGSDARLHRVERDGRSQVVLTAADTHFTALAADRDGNVYVGSSPGGIVYRLDREQKTFVLVDSPFREVKALEVGAGGTLYAALIDGTTVETPAAPATALTTVSPGGAEVTVSEAYAIALPATLPAVMALPPSGTGGGPAKGAVLRLSQGDVETLWSSADDAPHALLATPGGVLVGTGDKGKLYSVRDDRTWSMVGVLPSQQATAIVGTAGGAAVVATSNPGRLHSLDAAPGPTGTFTSAVKDAATVAAWGQVRWDASLAAGTAIDIRTRSGNTGAPDTTWSDWSGPYAHADGDAVTSPRARFLQLRATLRGGEGRTPVLDTLSTAFLQRNLRPQVVSVTLHPPGEVFQKPLSVGGEIEILGLESDDDDLARAEKASPNTLLGATTYSRKLYQRGIQTVSWKAEDPNQDPLVYDVSYRRVADPRFRPLRTGLTEAVMAWDTTTMPNGRYVLRLTARDTPGNPPGLALGGDKETAPFEIDNSPPQVVASLIERSPPRVRVVARDDGSLIRKAEYSVDGQRWQEVHPEDGIDDGAEETFAIAPALPPTPGPHLLVVRVTDLLGNQTAVQVDLP